MANWIDYASFTITVSLIIGVIYAVVYMNEQIRQMFRSTKESLHNKGVDISDRGISLKTHSKLANRENYVDSTQRGFIKALGASSGGHSANNSPNMAAQAQASPNLKRRNSASSQKSTHSFHIHRNSDAVSLH